jgi:L-ascorbate metabolism protein UlaG (beta-lactamase superfamily)
MNILTDPIWSDRASPVWFSGPRRRSNPGVPFDGLPSIHVVLISHDHYDHLDMPSLRRLHREHDPVFITGLGNGRRLHRAGIPGAVERDWWDRVDLQPGLAVNLVRSKHFSGRGPFDHNKTLWCGFVVSSPAGNVYFAGDTGYGDHFQEIASRFGPIRAAMLPIGAFRPEWFMGEVHCTPLEALRAHEVLRSDVSIAIHHSTFPLGDDGQDEATNALRNHLRHTDLGDSQFWILQPGEGRDLPVCRTAAEHSLVPDATR